MGSYFTILLDAVNGIGNGMSIAMRNSETGGGHYVTSLAPGGFVGRPLRLGAGLNVGLEVFFGLITLCVSGVMSRLI